MDTQGKIIILGAFLILVVGMYTSLFIDKEKTTVRDERTGAWACKVDTQMCPDGTTVGRVPPYCHFADCATF